MGNLQEFSNLIIELNRLAPDIAELDLKNNLDASRRVINGLTTFEKRQLEPFKKKMKEIRTNILLTNKQKQK